MVPGGDRGRDRQAATPPAPAPPRPTYELGYGRRQAGPGVGHLDPCASAVGAAMNLDHPSPMLDGVRD